MAASIELIPFAEASEKEAVLTVWPSEIMVTAIVSPLLEPTWNVIVEADDSSEMPLNCAAEPIRSISDDSWLTSDWIAAWSVGDRVPFWYWTARSRMRWSI